VSNMRISVLIPAYNCQATIRETLDSVLAQTRAADEILVIDDGSTDQTPEILEFYKPRVQVFRQKNLGVAAARNALIEHAEGDLLAWLDSDDVWHPRCLEVHSRLFTDYPEAGALFVGHLNFRGMEPYTGHFGRPFVKDDSVVIDPLNFLKTLISASGRFMGAFCCIPRRSALCIGGRVAPDEVRYCEDFYMLCMVALKGLSVVYAPYPLVAYRVRQDSLSRPPLPNRRSVVEIFQLLEPLFRASAPMEFRRVFEVGFASARRRLAKALMGAGRTLEARREIASSFAESYRPESLLRSAALLAVTFSPRPLQPKWPTSMVDGSATYPRAKA
jgi:glycosyltransferase involved in cell wall biosynthesis